MRINWTTVKHNNSEILSTLTYLSTLVILRIEFASHLACADNIFVCIYIICIVYDKYWHKCKYV